MKLKVIVSEFVSEDELYIANPAALDKMSMLLGLDAPTIDAVLDPERVIFCGSEKKAEEIRAAAKKVGSVKLI